MEQERVTLAKGALGVLAIIVIVACYVGLSMAVGSTQLWAGFMFGVCFGMIEQLKMERLPHAGIGSLIGILVGAAYVVLPPILGPVGGVAVPLALSMVLVFLLTMQWLPIAVNTSTMVYITLLTIPQIATGASVASILLGFGVGVAFFGTLGLIAHLATTRSRGPAPQIVRV